MRVTCLMLSMRGKNFSRQHFKIFFLFFPENRLKTFHVNYLLRKNKKKYHKFFVCQICSESYISELGRTIKIMNSLHALLILDRQYLMSSFIFIKNSHKKNFNTSRKHTYIILPPLKPHFYTVKLGSTGVYIIFLILLKKNIDCGYSLELPC